jgi:hypothetical protein
VVLKEPTSLNGGEGLVTRLTRDVGGTKSESGGGEVVVDEENKRRSTVITVDVHFKLRSSHKDSG